MDKDDWGAMETMRVAAAIIEREGRVLAARRADTAYAGCWEFPGGKVEPGEDSEQALRREIREELGASLQVAWLLDTFHHDYPDFHLQMDVFVCTLAPDAEPVALEHTELRWLSLDELPDVEWLPADRQVMLTLGVMWERIFEEEHL